MAKCDGCGCSTGTAYGLAWDHITKKPSTAKRCAACVTLVALHMHPRIKLQPIGLVDSPHDMDTTDDKRDAKHGSAGW